ncbi:uncharacterized protein LOC131001343 [Salvia miltiorrhiza]|uniref:uncharacterized protein LOC131001343 n=1 Tax=Salvia miltiorrhiza TaxID=226208 RepID=UPI0025ABAABA|nr:uncharacterized protein LOC131001343 [Salvia miltiorrhiza]
MVRKIVGKKAPFSKSKRHKKTPSLPSKKSKMSKQQVEEPATVEEHTTTAAGSPSTATMDEQIVEEQPPMEERRFKWVRPELQGYQARTNLYVRVEVLTRIRQKLHSMGMEERLLDGTFGHLAQMRRSSSANNALSEFIARELHDVSFPAFEQRYFVGGHEIRFTARDYALVTGLRFGPCKFDPTKDDYIIPDSLHMRHFQGGKVRVKMLEHEFNTGLLRDPADYLKAAYIIILYQILICRGDTLWIEDWVWALVEDEDAWASFPWGSYSFSILCHQMSVVAKHPNQIQSTRRTYHIFGPVWAFQIWMYEVLPKLGKLCGKRDSDTSIPRFLHWDTHAAPSVDFSEFFDRQLAITPMVPTPMEEAQEFFLSVVRGDHMKVVFQPSKRHAAKKLLVDEDIEEVEEDEPPKKRKRGQHKSKEDEPPKKTKRGHQPESSAAAEKRQRRHSPEPAQPSTTCCLHGLPCQHADIDEEAHFERLARRISPHMLLDDSEKGWISRLAHKLLDIFRQEADESPSVSATPSSVSRGGPIANRPLVESEVYQSQQNEQQVAGDVLVETIEEQVEEQVEEPQPQQVEEPQPQQVEEHVEEQAENEPSTPSVHFDEDSPESDEDMLPPDLGPRVSRPSAALRSPYESGVSTRAPGTPASLKRLYKEFRSKPADAKVVVRSTGHDFDNATFADIEDISVEFTGKIIDCYLIYMRERVKKKCGIFPSVNEKLTKIVGCEFYTILKSEFEKLHGPKPTGVGHGVKSLYGFWKPPKGLVADVGEWKHAKQLIIICNVGGCHWVVLRVRLHEWIAELYDSLAYKYDTEAGVSLSHRELELKPITRLLPRLLRLSHYWKHHDSKLEELYEILLKLMPASDQFCQTDSTSCGPFCTMILDRLVTSTEHHRGSIDEQYLSQYRLRVGRRIFSVTM